jgi:hypothetical protein
MKKLLIVSLLIWFGATASAQKSPSLKIIYFHSEHRCPTCISIEENTLKTLNTYFSQQMKQGVITFVSLNVEDKKNIKLVEKYQAEGSSLYLTQVKNSAEKTTDYTNFAFSYSRSQPEKFISGLKTTINELLK